MHKKIDDVNFADLIIVVIVFLLIENQFKKRTKIFVISSYPFVILLKLSLKKLILLLKFIV